MEDSNSILDRVIAASREETLANFNPVEIVNKLFHNLASREQDVLRRRFGLSGNKKATLEEIGQSYKVTRERVRQVENAAIRNIKSRPEFRDSLKPIELAVLACLEKNGGVMAEDHLLEYLLSAGSGDHSQKAHLLFLLEKLSSDRIVKENVDGISPSWRASFVGWEKALATIEAIISILEKIGSPISEEDLLARFRDHEIYASHKQHFGFNDNRPEPIIAHIRLSEKVKKNSFNELGLAHWATVSPRRMGDKIYLVLKKHGKPMHFREITEQINQTGFDAKKAYAPTVHNELILDKRYVLVGRGIYALSEWGYAPGVVGDVIASVLKQANTPLSREEIVDAVMKQRMVKRGTIFLALSNQDRFERDANGNYSLKVAQ